MNKETIENLTKLCRVCFGKGEHNLWEFMVMLPTEEEPEDLETQTSMNGNVGKWVTEEITAQDMLIVFSNKQVPELDREIPLQLICQLCLDELIASFMFLRKVEKAGKKLAEFLTAEDGKIEKDFRNEQIVEYLEDISEYVEESTKLEENFEQTTEIVKTCTNAKTLYYRDKEIRSVEDLPVFSIENEHKRKMTKNPTFVPNGGVSQIHAHMRSITQESKVIEARRAPTKSCSQKRLKIQREKQQQHEPLEQGGSFIVTQFIPSQTQLRTDAIYGTSEEEQHHGQHDYPIPCHELRTMDYAAVEIQSDSVVKIDETDTNMANKIAMAHSGDDGASSLIQNPSSQPIYVCKYCPQAFSAVHFLITHARKSHVCKFCPQAFAKTQNLYEHTRNAHSEHKCVICGKELSTHSNLRSHIKRVHGVKLPAQVALLDYRRGTVAKVSAHDNYEQLERNIDSDFMEIVNGGEEEAEDQYQEECIAFESNVQYIKQIEVETLHEEIVKQIV